jgi:hypothetical protein
MKVKVMSIRFHVVIDGRSDTFLHTIRVGEMFPGAATPMEFSQPDVRYPFFGAVRAQSRFDGSFSLDFLRSRGSC